MKSILIQKGKRKFWVLPVLTSLLVWPSLVKGQTVPPVDRKTVLNGDIQVAGNASIMGPLTIAGGLQLFGKQGAGSLNEIFTSYGTPNALWHGESIGANETNTRPLYIQGQPAGYAGNTIINPNGGNVLIGLDPDTRNYIMNYNLISGYWPSLGIYADNMGLAPGSSPTLPALTINTKTQAPAGGAIGRAQALFAVAQGPGSFSALAQTGDVLVGATDHESNSLVLLATSHTGAGSAFRFVFRAPGGEFENVTISQSGNVGIGTNSPGYALHIKTPVSQTDQTYSEMRLEPNTWATGSASRIWLGGTDDADNHMLDHYIEGKKTPTVSFTDNPLGFTYKFNGGDVSLPWDYASIRIGGGPSTEGRITADDGADKRFTFYHPSAIKLTNSPTCATGVACNAESGLFLASNKVGIGTSSPTNKLTVLGDGVNLFSGYALGNVNTYGSESISSPLMVFAAPGNNLNGSTDYQPAAGFGFIDGGGDNVVSPTVWMYGNSRNAFTIRKTDYDHKTNEASTVFVVRPTGQTAIGTTNIPNGYTLAVGGKIVAEEVLVKLQYNGSTYNWPDYVFDKGYDLNSLTEVEDYISKNKHLPEIPSAKEVEDNGVTLGEMNAKLLKKVEELTLYLIEQEKKMQSYEKRIQQLENK